MIGATGISGRTWADDAVAVRGPRTVGGGAALDFDGVAWLLDALADALAPRLLDRLERDQVSEDRWMDTAEAAEYLGRSKASLHKLTAAKAVPFQQAEANCKLWFLRSELDAWLRGEEGLDR